jgi:hypothetical protein
MIWRVLLFWWLGVIGAVATGQFPATNWTAGYDVPSHLTTGTCPAAPLAIISNYISQGATLLVPQNGAIPVTGPGSFAAYGYVVWQQTPTLMYMGMFVLANDSDGFVAYPAAVVSPDYTELSVVNQPSYFETTPEATPALTTADPVDMADGTFQVEQTGLALGQAEPRGITLSRYYNGTRRFSNPAGMVGGWLHNYCVTANNVAAPAAGLGQTTPAQMASMLVATSATLDR